MKEIHTEIEINATAEKVWQVLTDFAAFPEWNPFGGLLLPLLSKMLDRDIRRGFEEMNWALKLRAESAP